MLRRSPISLEKIGGGKMGNKGDKIGAGRGFPCAGRVLLQDTQVEPGGKKVSQWILDFLSVLIS